MDGWDSAWVRSGPCSDDNSKKRKALEYRRGERKAQLQPGQPEKDIHPLGLDILQPGRLT